MTFKQISQHERWIRFRDKHKAKFELFVRENLAAVTENDFAEYLKNGTHPDFRSNIGSLHDDEFLSLEEIANGWFDFQECYVGFDDERIKRFNRYG